MLTTSDARCAGGRGVIEGLGAQLGLSKAQVEASFNSLYWYGNTSSASLWYVLSYIEAVQGVRRGEVVWQVCLPSVIQHLLLRFFPQFIFILYFLLVRKKVVVVVTGHSGDSSLRAACRTRAAKVFPSSHVGIEPCKCVPVVAYYMPDLTPRVRLVPILAVWLCRWALAPGLNATVRCGALADLSRTAVTWPGRHLVDDPAARQRVWNYLAANASPHGKYGKFGDSALAVEVHPDARNLKSSSSGGAATH